MYFTTGLEWDQIIDLCARINSLKVPDKEKKWPPSLGLVNSVIVTLKYKRHNTAQAEIGEIFVSLRNSCGGLLVSTISRSAGGFGCSACFAAADGVCCTA